MKQITGEEFIENIKKDPSWCLGIKEPLEITTCINLTCSEITHLSPLITFSGKEEAYGWSATFYNCKNLKVATGTFYKGVDFRNSGVTIITNLTIENATQQREKADFEGCPIKYIPKKYRKIGFIFDYGIIEQSILKDKTIKNTIDKIKSETNNIII